MKFKNALQQLHNELNSLVFARVIRPICKDEHKLHDGSYSYYYGFATEVDLLGKNKDNRIWFKKTTKKDGAPIYIGPVALHASKSMPPARSIIVGIIDILPKGRAFRWWIDDVQPLLYFCRYLKYQSGVKPNSAHLYQQLALKDTTYHDELWAMLKLLLFGDVLSFVKESGPVEQRARHPVVKADTYTFKKGYTLRETPARFVLGVSLLTRDMSIYDRYVTLLHVKGYTNTLDITPTEAEQFLHPTAFKS